MTSSLAGRPEGLPPESLITRRQLRLIIPASDMTIWRWERAGSFPRHIQINGRNYWRASDVNAWFASHQPIVGTSGGIGGP